ncbi:MAG TPA: ATP-binding cassette domain-containing protein [Saprospiraceae bacterium]|nr:ATP-binding cassette domain-containing protein [Saprospiraceae bacterium]
MEDKNATPVLEVRQLSKLYNKDQRKHDSIREEIVAGVKSIFRPKSITPGAHQFWALKEVSFELNRGDVLGVIGPNGAGKSTLLKILSEITAPSSGDILYEGELTPILEVGTGFHPDLSGRENIFLNAAVLGMSKADIQARLPEIIAFSGVEAFIDTPVKHYSSGMFLRLAFSIAFHVDIDILVLDEVLAVGDAAFQRKSFDRIRELAASGATIILASHTNRQIFELCNKCLWLEKGQVRAFGKTKNILGEYLEEVLNEQMENNKLTTQRESQYQKWPAPPNVTSTEHFSLLSLSVTAKGKTPKTTIYTSDEIVITIGIQKDIGESSMEVGIRLLNAEGTQLILDSYAFRPAYTGVIVPKGRYLVPTTIPANLLNEGLYTLNIICGYNQRLEKEWPYLLKFRIRLAPEEEELNWTNSSLLKIPLSWDISDLGDEASMYSLTTQDS